MHCIAHLGVGGLQGCEVQIIPCNIPQVYAVRFLQKGHGYNYNSMGHVIIKEVSSFQKVKCVVFISLELCIGVVLET